MIKYKINLLLLISILLVNLKISAQNLIWAKSIDSTTSISIRTDVNDNVYTMGRFFGTKDFDPGIGLSLIHI